MKSRVVVGLCVLFVIASVGTASAQSSLRPSIKAGINFATVTGRFDEGFGGKKFRVGGVFGAGVSFVVNDRVSFDPDVLYSMEGVRVRESGVGGSGTETFAADYIRIPLLFRISGGGSRPAYLLLGPSIGVLVRAKYFDTDLKDFYNKGDFGFVVGGGGNMTENVFVEGRFHIGLKNINAENAGDAENRNNVFSVLIGSRF